MATKLDKSLKRELEVNGDLYMLRISPEGMKLVPKGKRKGHELTWKDLISGQTDIDPHKSPSIYQTKLRLTKLTTQMPAEKCDA
jgi:hypothetical protein